MIVKIIDLRTAAAKLWEFQAYKDTTVGDGF